MADNQIAPPAFLWIVKAATLLLGTHEWVLRLLPFLAGALSIPLTYFVARRLLGRPEALLATAILAWSQPLVYFASELKPYATDALAALAGYALYGSLLAAVPATPSVRRCLALGALGAALPWLSYPSAFVLAGIGLALAWPSPHPDRRRPYRLAALGLCWALGLALLYLAVLRHGLANDFLRDFWRDFFAPFPPRSLVDLYWFPQSWFDFLVYAAGLPFYGLATLSWLAGIRTLWCRGRQPLALALVGPLVFATLASMLRLYPLHVRVLLFAVPPTVLLVAAGARALAGALADRSRTLAGLFLALLLFHPLYRCLTVLATPWSTEEPRPAIEHIAERIEAADRVYVYHAAEPAFRYYAPRFGLQDPALSVVGQPSNGDFDRLADDIERLRGTRVWFLFSHSSAFDGIDERSFMLRELGRRWDRLDAFESPGSGAYLYDLRP